MKPLLLSLKKDGNKDLLFRYHSKLKKKLSHSKEPLLKLLEERKSFVYRMRDPKQKFSIRSGNQDRISVKFVPNEFQKRILTASLIDSPKAYFLNIDSMKKI